jgi:hypothetical protein
VPNACGSVNCNFLPGTHPGIAKDAHGEVYMKGKFKRDKTNRNAGSNSQRLMAFWSSLESQILSSYLERPNGKQHPLDR